MSKDRPPKWADRFLEWYCRSDLLDEIQGDLHELFDKRVHNQTLQRASLRYIWDVIRSLRISTVKNIHPSIHTIMFQHYFKIAFRNIWKHKSYAAINLLGLTVGIATSVLIFLWVADEMSYDRFHTQKDRLFRVMVNFTVGNGQTYTWESTPYPLADKLIQDYPEIEQAHYVASLGDHLLTVDNVGFKEQGLAVDSAFLSSFSFSTLQGSQSIQAPNEMIITEEFAGKCFGKDWQQQNLIGEIIQMDDSLDYQIAGVVEEVPSNSTLQFDFLTSLDAYLERTPWNREWGNFNHTNYVRLTQPGLGDEVTNKIKSILMDRLEGEDMGGSSAYLFLQPLTDIYLYSNFENGKVAGGRIDYVKAFILVAIFLLLIAAINYMNLATARAGLRTREIGVKKAVGATRTSLIRQFLSESFIFTTLAYMLAIGVVFLLIPLVNQLTGKEITLALDSNAFILFSLCIILGVSIAAGVYPAFFLSSTRTVDVLKGQVKKYFQGNSLRRILVVVQFSLSILMILGTLVIYRQIQYIKEKNLGINKENVVMTSLEGISAKTYPAFKEKLLQSPHITEVTAANFNPLMIYNSTTSVYWEGKSEEDEVFFHITQADYDYVETMKIPLLAGRTHNQEMRTDSAGYIINQRAAEAMGMNDPIGKSISVWGNEGNVIGLIEDHHISSLYDPIEPFIVFLSPNSASYLFARTVAGNTQQAIAEMEMISRQFRPQYPFEYEFLDQSYEAMYKSEMITGTLARYFAIIGIFISCLGLLGLAAFTAARRAKEISIRKVMGASVADLVILLTKDFTRLVLIAIVLALPLGGYLALNWLDSFAYHTELSPTMFIGSSMAAVLIAWITISFQAIKTASSNPVRFLQSE